MRFHIRNEGVENLEIYYHGTSYEDLADILKFGLLPQEPHRAVYLVGDPNSALVWGPVILKIEVPKGFVLDTEFGLLAPKGIPPFYIKVHRRIPQEEWEEMDIRR